MLAASSSSRVRLLLGATLVVVCAVLAHSPALDGAFVYDDAFAIVRNTDVASLDTPLAAVFGHDFWGQALHHDDSNKSFRPLTTLSFRLDHYLAGALEPRRFHRTNAALHALASTLVLALARRHTRSDWAALAASLSFAVHPIHSEAVASVVGRAELLSAVVALAGVLVAPHGFALGVGLVAASTLCKETGLSVFAVLLVQDALDWLRTSVSLRALVRYGRRRWWTWALCVGVTCAYFYGRARLAGSVRLLMNRRLENPLAHLRGWPLVLSTAHMHYMYFALLFVPHPLSFDYSYPCVTAMRSLDDARMLGVVGLYASAAGALALALTVRTPSLVMAVTVMLACFLPASNVIFAVGTFVAERLLYLPSIGHALLLGFLVDAALERLSRRLAAALLVALALATAPVLALARAGARRWLDDGTLVRSGLVACANSSKVQSNYGIVLRQEQRYDASIAAFNRAQRLWPGYCEQVRLTRACRATLHR